MRVNYEHHNVRRFLSIFSIKFGTPHLSPDRVTYKRLRLTLLLIVIDKLYFTYGAILNNPILYDQIMHSM